MAATTSASSPSASPAGPPRCALLGLDDEPLAGTGPHAPRWLLVEDPGPWGRDGLADGRLPQDVRDHLTTQVTTHDVRYQALRRIDRSRPASRTVMLVNLADGWMAATRCAVEDIVDLDVGLVARATPPRGWDQVTEPVIAVCTHAKRDACCALWGRPLARALAAMVPNAVWETSHTGGHRFAPSVLTFPDGGVHGRVSDAAGFAAAVSAGRIPLATYRGNAGLAPPAQAAEVAVRVRDHLEAVDEVVVHATTIREASALVVASTPAGSHVVTVERGSLPPRPTSCGGTPKDPGTWLVRSIADEPFGRT